MNYWHLTNPTLFEDFKQLLNKEFPHLSINIENNTVFIRGHLILYNPERTKIIKHYSVEIEIPKDYPKSIPLMRETAGILPKTPNRHFNPDNRCACLFLPDERYRCYPEGSSIIDFIKGPVTNFFFSQICFDLTNEWPWGERGHGTKGIIEFYEEELGTSDLEVIIACLRYLTKNDVKGHLPCYCGSGLRLRKCHQGRLNDLRSKISRNDAEKSLLSIKTKQAKDLTLVH
jgi:hypothetical protein